MKMLGLMGSSRTGGNTDILLDACIKGAESLGLVSEKIIVDKLTIVPCREYYGCLRDGNCVMEDDMQTLYPKLLEADIVVVASPIFFYGLPGQLKNVIDRCQALWARRSVLHQQPSSKGRKGAFIAVGATRGKRMFDGSILTIKYVFREIGVSYSGQLLISGVDTKGEITSHLTAFSDARDLNMKLGVKSN